MKKTEYTCDLCKRNTDPKDILGVRCTVPAGIAYEKHKPGSEVVGSVLADAHVCMLCVDAIEKFMDKYRSREERAIAP